MRGDEAQIVNLLNTCFGDWGTLEKWAALYLQYPTFEEENVFVIEKKRKIIGHEALHFRDLIANGKRSVSTVSLSDAVVHPDFRGQGLHNQLLDVMLNAATSKGAGLVFSWYLRDSGLHKHSKKLGFVEVWQASAYMKIMRPEKLLRSGLRDFLHKSPDLRDALDDLSDSLYFRFGASAFSMAELLGKADQQSVDDREKTEIIFKESSFPTLVKLRNMSRRRRFWSLVYLLLLRRARIRFGSFKAFVSLARKGFSIAAST
jgi:ribosomal protein S18 acetylase RimI-like enzyme